MSWSMKLSADDMTVKLKCRDLRRGATRIFRLKLIYGGVDVVGQLGKTVFLHLSSC